MSRDKKDLHPTLASAYETACELYKAKYPSEPQPFLSCTFRSNDEQNALYNIGRTVKGSIVTNAKGGQSPHNFNPSLAFDIAFIGLNKKLSWDKKYFKMFADLIVSEQVEWGGSWKFTDAPHFELKGWKNMIK